MKKITEEDKYNAEFLANPYFIGTHGAEVVSAHQVGFNNGVEWALKQMDSKKEDIQFYKDAEKKAWYYIKNEVYFDMDYYRWFKAKMEAEKEGKEFTEPEPKFDNEKVKFNGIDMFNAFMRGYRLYRELRDGEFVLGLDNTEEKTLNETAKKDDDTMLEEFKQKCIKNAHDAFVELLSVQYGEDCDESMHQYIDDVLNKKM